MPTILFVLLAGLIGYFFGAIPFGFLFVKATKKVDLREVGSGRTGGTNSFRAAGLPIGILTSISDFLKGAGAIWLARAIFGGTLDENWLPWAEIATGVMAVVGHNWSIFLGFKGGAGTGPNVGWSAAVWLPMLPISLIVLIGLFLGVGMASVASLGVAVAIFITFAIRYLTGAEVTAAYMVGAIATTLIVAWALRPNIRRIFNGTERVVGPVAKRRLKQAGS
jgi:acyl phosphate:glycerol-3-phosphate acyltransferase